MPRSQYEDDGAFREIADAVLQAGRALLEVSARTLEAAAPGVGATGLRALAVLNREGPQRLIDVATALDVTPTTATRLADRLAEAGLVERLRVSSDRREVHLAISPAGQDLVRGVVAEQSRYVASAIGSLPTAQLAAAVGVLEGLAGGRSVGRSADRSLGRSADRSVGRSADRSVGRPGDGSAGHRAAGMSDPAQETA